jgi:hypothetical protein
MPSAGVLTWNLIWLAQANLENATSVATVLACFDDKNEGIINETALNEILVRAEVQTMAKLHEYGPPPFSVQILAQLGADDYLRAAATERAIILMYDRAPEAVRQSVNDLEKRRKDWKEMMDDILQARARPPTVPTPPANVGGVSVYNTNRIFVDNPGGPSGGNAGDY